MIRKKVIIKDRDVACNVSITFFIKFDKIKNRDIFNLSF